MYTFSIHLATVTNQLNYNRPGVRFSKSIISQLWSQVFLNSDGNLWPQLALGNEWLVWPSVNLHETVLNTFQKGPPLEFRVLGNLQSIQKFYLHMLQFTSNYFILSICISKKTNITVVPDTVKQKRAAGVFVKRNETITTQKHTSLF